MPDYQQSIPEKEPQEMEELKNRIEKLESELKKEKIHVPKEKEKAVKKEIKDYLRELQQIPSSALPLNDRDEVNEIEKFPPSQQVGVLVALVFEKGLPEAISIAKALDNPAILDEFHDVLVDRYYKDLIEREILKPM